MVSNQSFSDVYDTNKKTGALILGKNRLEDYATKYLTKHCKEALETPMPLPVEKIIQDENLTVKEVSLSADLDIFGCCMLLDGQVRVYDEETEDYHLEDFSKGTILFDPKSEAKYGEGSKRNTLIHEALHWEKDRVYFEILKLKNQSASEKLYPIMCRQSSTFFEPPEGKKTKENEVKWLEWQAHRLAPRILMPYEMFRKKAEELISKHVDEQNPSCDSFIQELSDFFIVSRASVKYRIEEVGLIDKISDYSDFETVFADIHSISDSEYVSLSPEEAYEMLIENQVLQNWVKTRKLVYVDGYFVQANPKYVVYIEDGYHLTASAKRNIKKCALKIKIQNYRDYPHFKSDYSGCALMFRTADIKVADVDKRLVVFHPRFQISDSIDVDEVYDAAGEFFSSFDEEEEKWIYKNVADIDVSLCECLWHLFEARKWNYPAKFVEYTGLNTNYYGKIREDNYNNMGTDVLMAICVGLGLNLRLTEELFRKSKNKLDVSSNPDKAYIRVMEMMPGLSVNDFNSVLERVGVEPLGSKSRNG